MLFPSPAKVNLALSVDRPGDTGLHPLASWMVAVSFGDTLEALALDEGRASVFDLAFADDAPVKHAIDWPLERDLVFRAHGLLEQHTGRKLPARLTLRKRIPPGAGLGGGSSDAAGTLVALDQLFNLRLGEHALARLAMTLGSDVAFLVAAILGCPSAVVTGVGDMIEPATLPGAIHLALIFPRFDCPTAQVYRAFDDLGRVTFDPARVRELARRGAPKPTELFNDLAEPARRVRPELGLIQRKLRETLGRPVHVTGSGSTLYVLCDDPDDARDVSAKVTAAMGLPALPTRTL